MIKILASAVHHTIEFGDFDIYIVEEKDKKEHVVLLRGNVVDCEDVLCRVSSECLPGTALFSAECDCKQQITYALEAISKNESGILIYLRQEGRGHGLATKIKALKNKNDGCDTFEAVERLGLPADVREYSVVKEILEFFKIKSICCMCNNPDKVNQMKEKGVNISKIINIPITSNKYSFPHLAAKISHGHNIVFTDDNLKS